MKSLNEREGRRLRGGRFKKDALFKRHSPKLQGYGDKKRWTRGGRRGK